MKFLFECFASFALAIAVFLVAAGFSSDLSDLSDASNFLDVPDLVSKQDVLENFSLIFSFSCLLMVLAFIAGLAARPQLDCLVFKLVHKLRAYLVSLKEKNKTHSIR